MAEQKLSAHMTRLAKKRGRVPALVTALGVLALLALQSFLTSLVNFFGYVIAAQPVQGAQSSGIHEAAPSYQFEPSIDFVLTVLLPTIAYVAAMQWLGFYVASILFVACFMRFAGNLPWWKCLTISTLPMALFFWIFEKRFVVPLPKGPIEAWLGL